MNPLIAPAMGLKAAEVDMMRKKIFLSAALLPLVVVAVLAIFGAKLNVWVYIVLAVVCPLVAGLICFIYKDIEKKMETFEKEAGWRNKSR